MGADERFETFFTSESFLLVKGNSDNQVRVPCLIPTHKILADGGA
jgi:hypothetical protein